MKKIEDILEQTLKSEPIFKLSVDFKDRVVKSIRRMERRSQRRFYAFMAFGIMVIMGLGIMILAYFQSLETLNGFKNIVPIAVLIGGVIAIIQYLDNKLVKKKMFTQEFS